MSELMSASPPSPDTPTKRSPWWIEVLLLGAGYWVYSWIADQAPRRDPLHNGRQILEFEQSLHIDIEHAVNQWWASNPHAVLVLGNLYYDLMHFIVPVGTLLWVYFFRPEIYRRVRTPLVIVSLVALAIFWAWPTAPPRLLPGLGIYDTIAQVHTLGGGGSHGMTASENPFGSFPSLHVAWATWACYAIWSSTRSVLWRLLLALNVAAMGFIVIATGNHWVLDVVAGFFGVFASIGLMVAAGLAWRAARRSPASATAPVPASIVDARR